VPGPAGSENKIDVRVAGPLWHNERLEDPKQLIAFIESMSATRREAEEGAVYIGASAITTSTTSRTGGTARSARWSSASRGVARSRAEAADAAGDHPRAAHHVRRRLPRDSNLISLIRNVKWKQEGSAESNIQRGKEALGRRSSRGTGVADFPEEFTLTVKVFENVPQTVTVRVALELLPDVERFEVIPFPNQIHDGVAETLTWLQEDIAATKVPTFIGSVG
jgi:hypothetical protein